MNNFYKILSATFAIYFTFSYMVAQENTPANTSISHAVKTQYHRWFQLYEREINDARITNQLGILDKNIVIESVAGSTKGRDNYPKRVKVYKKWKNAHHVQDVTIEEKNESLVLNANIIYQSILPDGVKKSFALHYRAHLKNTDGLLPVFTRIKISPKGEINKVFRDAYPNNRIKSLMHYWLLCMEQLDGNVEPFEELLTENFELNFSTHSQITSVAQFKKWLNGMPMQLQSSQHFPQNLVVKSIEENKYEVSVQFEWLGVMKNGVKWKATTEHNWIVIDDINKRFAKIQKVNVKQLKPLQQY